MLAARGHANRIGAAPSQTEASQFRESPAKTPPDQAEDVIHCKILRPPLHRRVTVGRATDMRAPGPVSANVHVEALVPQVDVLAEATAVICHDGSGTTFGALAAGLKLVIVPMFADQPANARPVASAEAGIAVTPTGAPTAASRRYAPRRPGIRRALESLLADNSYRQAAQGIAAELSALPTTRDLLDTLQNELVSSQPARPSGDGVAGFVA